jgi:hypothetical protein
VRIAALERFSDESRRCDPARIAGPDDDVVVWDLSRAPGEPLPSLLQVVLALHEWATLKMRFRHRWQLLLLCARMHGWRRVALVRVPGWVNQLHGNEIEEIACFSARGFDLAWWFANELGQPCREMVGRGTQYLGEFAFEQLAVIPYAYWLHLQGKLEFTVSTPDTACLYYFSPAHTEVPADRRFVPITDYPVAEIDETWFDHSGFPTALDTKQWCPPPYRDVYADDGRFRWSKPLVIVCNKTNVELYPGTTVSNHIDTDVLLVLMRELATRYTVVYNRPRASDIVSDHAEILEQGDIEAVKRELPGVLTVQELHSEHSDLSFNELQLRLFATCKRFVSVLGGASYLASYFGGTNIVYAQAGWEATCGAYENWFHLFSGARVVAVAKTDDLLQAVRAEFLGDECS